MIENSLTSVVETTEDGNIAFDVPTELLQALGWKAGDTLEIEVIARRISIRKVE